MKMLLDAFLLFFLLQPLPAERELHQRTGIDDGVWIVDFDGGGDFTEIQPAIDAAASGDLIIVRVPVPFRSYAGFQLTGKGVHVVGDRGQPFVNLQNQTEHVSDVAAGESVVLRNVSAGSGITAARVPGTLWLEEVFAGGYSGGSDFSDVGEVVAVRSNLTGATFPLFALGLAPGIAIQNGALYLFESQAAGESGSPCNSSASNDGGHGVAATNATFLSFDSTLTGGLPGEECAPTGCFTSGSTGLSYSGASSTAYRVRSQLPQGTSGPVTTLLGERRSTSAPALVDEGTPVSVTVTGPAGNAVWSLVSPDPEVAFEVSLYAPTVTGTSPIVLFQGLLPASGTMTFDLELPIPRGKRGFRAWVVQTLQLDNGVPYLSSGSVTHVVRPGLR